VPRPRSAASGLDAHRVAVRDVGSFPEPGEAVPRTQDESERPAETVRVLTSGRRTTRRLTRLSFLPTSCPALHQGLNMRRNIRARHDTAHGLAKTSALNKTGIAPAVPATSTTSRTSDPCTRGPAAAPPFGWCAAGPEHISRLSSRRWGWWACTVALRPTMTLRDNTANEFNSRRESSNQGHIDPCLRKQRAGLHLAKQCR
jgi:hypothetical protein